MEEIFSKIVEWEGKKFGLAEVGKLKIARTNARQTSLEIQEAFEKRALSFPFIVLSQPKISRNLFFPNASTNATALHHLSVL